MDKSEVLSFISGLSESSLLACSLFDACVDEALNVRIIRNGVEVERSVQEIAADAARKLSSASKQHSARRVFNFSRSERKSIFSSAGETTISTRPINC